MGTLSRVVDRTVNRTAHPGRLPASDEATALVARTPVVDLCVGSALFRDSFVEGSRRGHVDLPRLRAAGVRVLGLTVATAWPDVNGSLSRWHFRSLGLPKSAVGSHMAVAEWAISRINRWCDESGGQMVVIRTAADLEECRRPGGPVGVIICGQGGHMLDGRVENVTRLRDLGVRLFAPAHVMDNDLVGSNTGRSKGRLSLFGREVIAELEAQKISVDLAHMSVRGIEQTLPLLERPFMLSHTGLTDIAASRSRFRRYSAATRNIPASLAAQIGSAGGTVGIVMSTQLLGSNWLSGAVATIRLALESVGVERVAIGSDMDGALKMVIDVEGYPALADALLRSELPPRTVEGVMGRNAIAALQTMLA